MYAADNKNLPLTKPKETSETKAAKAKRREVVSIAYVTKFERLSYRYLKVNK